MNEVQLAGFCGETENVTAGALLCQTYSVFTHSMQVARDIAFIDLYYLFIIQFKDLTIAQIRMCHADSFCLLSWLLMLIDGVKVALLNSLKRELPSIHELHYCYDYICCVTLNYCKGNNDLLISLLCWECVDAGLTRVPLVMIVLTALDDLKV